MTGNLTEYVWSRSLASRPNPVTWLCYYCDRSVSSSQHFWYIGKPDRNGNVSAEGFIAICSNCFHPTFFWKSQPERTGAEGNTLTGAPDNLKLIYDEARRCMSVSAYTAAVLMCRRLIIDLCHEIDSEHFENKARLKFEEYIDWLESHGHIPPRARPWVDQLRVQGNQKTHRTEVATSEEAAQLITFAYFLISWTFEMPARLLPPIPKLPDS